MIDHIVFDIGRVLLHWKPELIYADLITDETERTAFLDIVAPWNAGQDLGNRSWREAEDALVAVHPDKEDLIRAYRPNWHKSTSRAYDDIVAVMLNLIDEGHDMTLLTNFNDDTWPIAQRRFDFLQAPRGVTVSGHVHLIKPDPAIFRYHEEVFGLDPAKTLFFDDSAKNVAGAKAHGWQAEQFEGEQGAPVLKELLARYDVAF